MFTKKIYTRLIMLFLLAALPSTTAVLAQREEPNGPSPIIDEIELIEQTPTVEDSHLLLPLAQTAEKQLPAILEPGETMTITQWQIDESEPNNSRRSADQADYNRFLGGAIDYPGDVDFWILSVIPSNHIFPMIIDIDAQSIGSPLDSVVCLYDQSGRELVCSDDTDTRDSLIYYNMSDTYYIRVSDYYRHGGNNYKYRLNISAPLLMSAAEAGSVDGIPFQPGDVLAWCNMEGGRYRKWILLFDASDLGISANLTSLSAGWGRTDHLLLGFGTKLLLPGMSQAVTPWDIVEFIPKTVGPRTEGIFSLVWKGADVQLTTRGEKIDAFDLSGWTDFTHYSDFYVSTIGQTQVSDYDGSKLNLAGEDVAYREVGYHRWFHVLDGSTFPGLAERGVIALSVEDISVPEPMYFLTLQGIGKIGAEKLYVTQKDIVSIGMCFDTPCTGPNINGVVWHGPDYGFRARIDAIDVPELDPEFWFRF